MIDRRGTLQARTRNVGLSQLGGGGASGSGGVSSGISGLSPIELALMKHERKQVYVCGYVNFGGKLSGFDGQ